MPNPIKAFFEKKKAEAKFKLAGPGQKLGDADTAAQQAAARQRAAAAAASRPSTSGAAARPASAAQQAAAQAAMSRMNVGGGQHDDFEKKRSQAAIRAHVQKELEAERKAAAEASKLKETYGQVETPTLDAPPACAGVFFHCPLIGPEAFPKEEMKAKIRDFLYGQLQEEKGLTAALIIHTFAKNADTGRVCVETMCKYLDNILDTPDEEKFRKIRRSNRAFQDRVAAVEGHDLFLEAVGFECQELDGEQFWILAGELDNDRLEHIRGLREGLVHSEPIRAELDRDLRVLLPAQAKQSFSLPPDFFSLSAEEIRKEQQVRAELVEREGMLRTKAMREREEQREKRRYRYALIRVKFPDGIVIQATFSVHEKYRCVHDLVAECLELPLPFVLHDQASGHRLDRPDYDTSLVDLGLVPSAMLTFAWHPEVAAEVSAQAGPSPRYLKESVTDLVAP